VPAAWSALLEFPETTRSLPNKTKHFNTGDDYTAYARSDNPLGKFAFLKHLFEERTLADFGTRKPSDAALLLAAGRSAYTRYSLFS
jgi:hypothetical protein